MGVAHGSPVEVGVDDLTVELGEHRALAGVNLTAAAGDVVALVGPSGSGKTTLLRCIAGLQRPTTGSVRFDGEVIDAVPAHRRGVGYVFQDYALFPHRNVIQNVAFGLEMRGWDRRRRIEQARRMLDMVGLGSAERRSVTHLSGGEQQRVAIARALAPEPGLLLFDEPFGALDRQLREQMVVEVRDLIAEVGVTAVHVTHDQEEAAALGDTVAVLIGGRLRAHGTPGELWRRPPSANVARFLGLQVVTASVSGGRLIAGSLDLGSAPSGAAASSSTAEVVVPARSIQLRPAGSGDGSPGASDSAAAPGTVTWVQSGPDGDHVEVDLSGLSLTAALDAGHGLATGSDVMVRVRHEQVCVVTAEGESLA